MTDTKMEKLLAGQRAIVNDEWLNAVNDHPSAGLIRTAMNRRRVGILDQYVAWIADEAAPADLEIKPDRIKGQIAIGSL
jgi:hypothetical protein